MQQLKPWMKERNMLSRIEKKIAMEISARPDNPGWNLFRVFEIHGLFSVSLFRKALKELSKEHEILRTRFRYEQNEWHRVIEDDVTPRIEMRTVRATDPQQHMGLVQKQLIEWQNQPISLEDAPPYCFVGVIKTAWNHHFIMLRISHAIFDGISSSIIMHEIVRMYIKQLLFVSVWSKQHSQPPGAYACWQNEQLLQNEDARRFWEDVNQRFSATQIPMSADAPHHENTLAGGVRIRFSKESLGGLQKLRRQYRMTESFFLFTVFQLALYSETGNPDIHIRLTSSNRSQGEIEHTIGMFATGLPFPSRIDENKTFAEWSNCLREQYSKSLKWGYLYPEPMNKSPFILFNFYNSTIDEFYSKKLSYGLGSVRVRTDLVPFHLFSFHALLQIVRNMGPELEFFLLYRKAWYKEDSVQRVLNRYIELIRWIMANPDEPLSHGLRRIQTVNEMTEVA